ncbi:Rpr2-domain-containing protein [Venturia nashicola]|nr:Rpr2-domain-containing protein [Venturia nashicola]
MAKAKADNGVKRVQNRHCYSRIAFLHQAAQHLASKQFSPEPNTQLANPVQTEERPTGAVTDAPKKTKGMSNLDGEIKQTATLQPADGFGLSRRLASHLLTVSRKGSVGVSREMKRSICKRCQSILIPGQTADHKVQNKSRAGRKPCADVMVVTCSACGLAKRYPFGAQRQPRKKDRVAKGKTATEHTDTS